MRSIKQLVEELTDQRISNNIDNWKMLQHSLYVRVLRPEKHGKKILRYFPANKEIVTFRPAVIVITNTSY